MKNINYSIIINKEENKIKSCLLIEERGHEKYDSFDHNK